MISNQILQTNIEGLKGITRRDTVKRRGRYDFKSDFTVEYRRTERDYKN